MCLYVYMGTYIFSGLQRLNHYTIITCLKTLTVANDNGAGIRWNLTEKTVGKSSEWFFSVFILIRLLLARYTLHYFGFFFFVLLSNDVYRVVPTRVPLYVRVYLYSALYNYRSSGKCIKSSFVCVILRRSTCSISRLPVDLCLLRYSILSRIILKHRKFHV